MNDLFAVVILELLDKLKPMAHDATTMAPPSLRLIVAGFLALASAQQIGKIPEVHPRLTTWKCTKSRGCTAQNTSVVLDPDFRTVSAVHGSGLCKPAMSSAALNATLCPDAETCAANCALEGIANYTAFGVRTDGAASMTMSMYVDGERASPRVYLLAENGTHYEDIRLVNAEIAYDVDTSQMPCGMCGALYLSEMEMDGGRSDLNPAGASMGTGYCDALCPREFTWVNGVVWRFPFRLIMSQFLVL